MAKPMTTSKTELQALVDEAVANVRRRQKPAAKAEVVDDNNPANLDGGAQAAKRKIGGKYHSQKAKPRASSDYEVGYGRPPVKTQFQPGQTGNRKGRPKAARNVNTIIKDLVFKVREATIDGKKKRMTQFEIGIHQLMNKFMTGDAKAAAQVLALLTKMQEVGGSGKSDEGGEVALPTFTESSRRMLARHQSDLFREAGLSQEQIATLLTNLGLPIVEPDMPANDGDDPTELQDNDAETEDDPDDNDIV